MTKELVKLSQEYVAPLAGAWIEIREVYHKCVLFFRRSPRGSVD